MTLAFHIATPHPVRASRIHGWLAPLVDAPTLHAVMAAQALRDEAAASYAQTVEGRVLAAIARKPSTTIEVAIAIGVTRDMATNAVWKLRDAKRIEPVGKVGRGMVWRVAQ